MSERRGKSILAVAVGWVVIIVILAVVYRFVFRPAAEEKRYKDTGSDTKYTHEIAALADSFSGYAVLRSEALREDLAASGIRLTVEKDDADYVARMKAMRDGDADLAVFTVDSLIASGAAIGSFPVTIVLIIDETKGADAIITFESGVAQVNDLDHPEARFVLTPNSPSEFLARATIADFGLSSLPEEWIIEADGAADVYDRFVDADKQARRAYVMWEPHVSRAKERRGAKVLLDSANMKGYIIDVLVARRAFLQDHPDLVRKVVEAYLRVGYACRDDGQMTELVMEDAARFGERLTKAQAAALVAGIQWKNTLENYAHFGLLPDSGARGVTHVEDAIANIADVLVRTGALDEDPVAGRANTLFFDQVMRGLQSSDFHPGKKLNVMSGTGGHLGPLAQVRGDTQLEALSEAEWSSLVAVGEMRTKPISFARGAARINVQSERELRVLAKRLKAWPQYYLTVVGHTRSVGDREANRVLAEQRAQAVVTHLLSLGIHENRVRMQAVMLEGRGGEAQSVSFVVGQVPY